MVLTRREELILSEAAGKKVLHIGCCDTPSCQELAERGALLHMRLKDQVAELWGLDISKEDIEYLAEKHDLDKIVCGDAERIEDYFAPESFDVIVAGEVVEHLANPGLFLRGSLSLLRRDGVIVVSVPNGLAFRRGLKSLLGKETVHPDHNFWFSKRTICRLLSACGYVVREVHGLRLSRGRFVAAYFADIVSSLFSQFACEGILAVASKRTMANG